MFVSSPADWGQPKRPLLPPRLHWGQSESKMQNCKNFLKKLMLSSDQAMKIMKIMRIWMGVAIVPTTHRPQPRPHQGEFLRICLNIGCQVCKYGILNYIDLQIWWPLVVNFLNLWVCGLFRITNFQIRKICLRFCFEVRVKAKCRIAKTSWKSSCWAQIKPWK